MKWTCPSDKLPEARKVLDAAFAPAPEEAIIAALHGLRVMVRGRDGEKLDATSMEVELLAWASRLREYPGDVAICCLQDWPKVSPWWPTWFEFQDRLEKGMSQRKVMRHILGQLEREAPRGLTAQPETDERRAQVVEDALRKLTEATSMWPFTADRPQGETVAGRHLNPRVSDAERTKANEALATLEQTANERFSLSPMALKAVGITPPAPPEPEPEWHTDDPG